MFILLNKQNMWFNQNNGYLSSKEMGIQPTTNKVYENQ